MNPTRWRGLAYLNAVNEEEAEGLGERAFLFRFAVTVIRVIQEESMHLGHRAATYYGGIVRDADQESRTTYLSFCRWCSISYKCMVDVVGEDHLSLLL